MFQHDDHNKDGFLTQMQNHIYKCKNCTEHFFCEEADNLIKIYYPTYAPRAEGENNGI